MAYCRYYQAHVNRSECWFFVGAMRSFEYMSFDRTIDLPSSLFEFFVSEAMEEQFLVVMSYFQDKGVISGLKRLPNRLINPQEVV